MRPRESSRLEPPPIPVDACMTMLDSKRSRRAVEVGEVQAEPGARTRLGRLCNQDYDHIPARVLWAGLQALDFLGIGLIVWDASGRVSGLNRTAENVVRNRDGLELNSDGVLCTTWGRNHSVGQALKQATERVLFAKSGSQDTMLAVRRDSGKHPLTLYARSLRQMPAHEGSAQPMAMALVLDPSLPSRTTEAELRELYQLTSKEAQLAILLMEGKALKDCSRELGICPSTARSLLARIFKKTRVHRQSELVSMLLRSIGLAA